MIKGFAKAESGIQNDIPDAQSTQFCYFRYKKIKHFQGNLPLVSRRLLHGPGQALHMHQYIRDAEAGDRREHLRIDPSGGNIVNNMGAGLNRCLRNGGAYRID